MQELTEGLQTFDIYLTKQQVKALMPDTDVDGDGAVSFEEFIAQIEEVRCLTTRCFAFVGGLDGGYANGLRVLFFASRIPSAPSFFLSRSQAALPFNLFLGFLLIITGTADTRDENLLRSEHLKQHWHRASSSKRRPSKGICQPQICASGKKKEGERQYTELVKIILRRKLQVNSSSAVSSARKESPISLQRQPPSCQPPIILFLTFCALCTLQRLS